MTDSQREGGGGGICRELDCTATSGLKALLQGGWAWFAAVTWLYACRFV